MFWNDSEYRLWLLTVERRRLLDGSRTETLPVTNGHRPKLDAWPRVV